MFAAGNIVARYLRAVGVTKERVRAVTGLQDCGCDKRQAALNEAGYRFQRQLLLPAHWIAYRWRLVRYGPLAIRLWMFSHHLRKALYVLLYGR